MRFQEKESFGSTRLYKAPSPATTPPSLLTPSLNVQPALPLTSTRWSCAKAEVPKRAPKAAIAVTLPIIAFSFVWSRGRPTVERRP